MFRVQAPVIVIPTSEVRQATGKHLRAAMIDAYRAIARNGDGLEADLARPRPGRNRQRPAGAVAGL